MSSFRKITKNPNTGLWENALWIDDYFGLHSYGVEFLDGDVFNPKEIMLDTIEPNDVEGFNPLSLCTDYTFRVYGELNVPDSLIQIIRQFLDRNVHSGSEARDCMEALEYIMETIAPGDFNKKN